MSKEIVRKITNPDYKFRLNSEKGFIGKLGELAEKYDRTPTQKAIKNLDDKLLQF